MADTFTPTTREVLDHSSPSSIPEALCHVKIGEIIAGMIPRWVVKTDLDASAEQVHTDDTTPTPKEQPFQVIAVNASDDAPLAIIGNGAVGAGEVKIVMNTDGVPTFTFNAAVTGYKVFGCPLPKKLGELLDNKLNHKPAAYP